MNEKFSSGKIKQEETIFNLLPRLEISPFEPTNFQSKHRAEIIRSFKEKKFNHRTMGPADEPIPKPHEFLRSKKKILTRSQTEKDLSTIVARVPTVREMLKLASRTEKNFIEINSLDNVLAVPKLPQRMMVVDRHGDKVLLETSGLVPKFRLKKDFAEIPNYLKQRKNFLLRAKTEFHSNSPQQTMIREMNDDERKNLIEGLKRHWQIYNLEYQRISVIIDTLSKRTHKERLEHQMALLEKDIDLLQKHQIIYVTE